VYVDGIKAELAKVCADCKVSGYTNVPIPDWSQHLTQETRNLIASHADVNVLVPVYDGMVEFIAPGVTQANAAGRVMVVTHDGTPAVVSLIKSGEVVKADIGESREWQAWALADQSLRLLSGVAPVATENIPVRIWTKENAGEASGPNAENGYGDSYIAMYEKLWGLAK
jgi:ribose transport system substrate-binding protein